MQTYAYKRLVAEHGLNEETIEALNILGKEGWQHARILTDPDDLNDTILLQKDTMKTYEYKTLLTAHGLNNETIEALNNLGIKGWRQKDILINPEDKDTWHILLEKEIE